MNSQKRKKKNGLGGRQSSAETSNKLKEGATSAKLEAMKDATELSQLAGGASKKKRNSSIKKNADNTDRKDTVRDLDSDTKQESSLPFDTSQISVVQLDKIQTSLFTTDNPEQTNATEATAIKEKVLELEDRTVYLERQLDQLKKGILELLANKSTLKANQGWFYDARYTADLPNLHAPEFWDKHVKRWVGPEPFLEFRNVFELNNTYKIEIKIFDFITKEAKETFNLEIDGVTIPWDSQTNSVYVATYVSRITNSGIVRFAVNESKKPSEMILGATDNRILAFSFGYVIIKQVSV